MTPSLAIGNRFEWGVASRPLPGEAFSGDMHIVLKTPGGILAAVVDGLGHGDEATIAAKAAIDILKKYPEDSVISLVQRCHRALKATRGAVMTLVSFNAADDSVMAVGIGNVEAVLVRSDPFAEPPQETLLLRAGLVGYRLPAMHASVFPISPGDVMIFTTDGIRNDFTKRLNLAETLSSMTERILKDNFRGNDDALVLAVRYRKEAS